MTAYERIRSQFNDSATCRCLFAFTMTTITRDDTIHDVEYVTKHEAQLEIDAANHRGMIAAATLRNELTSIKGELKHHLAAFGWMDGPEGWTESCQRLAALIDANASDQATASK